MRRSGCVLAFNLLLVHILVFVSQSRDGQIADASKLSDLPYQIIVCTKTPRGEVLHPRDGKATTGEDAMVMSHRVASVFLSLEGLPYENLGRKHCGTRENRSRTREETKRTTRSVPLARI